MRGCFNLISTLKALPSRRDTERSAARKHLEFCASKRWSALHGTIGDKSPRAAGIKPCRPSCAR